MILIHQSDLEVFPECSLTQKFSLSKCDESQQGGAEPLHVQIYYCCKGCKG